MFPSNNITIDGCENLEESIKEEQFRMTIAIGVIALILALFAITIQLKIKDIQLNVLEIIGYCFAGYVALITISWTPKNNFFGKRIPREQIIIVSHYFYVIGIVFALSFATGRLLQNQIGISIDFFLIVPFLLFVLVLPFKVAKFFQPKEKATKKGEIWIK